MENQPSFDLNRAVAAWKEELLSQPGVSVEDVRELETHLLDTIAACKRPMSDEQAFREARAQMGSPREVAKEFVKAHPNRAWPERVFWMTAAVLISWAWMMGTGTLMNLVYWMFQPSQTLIVVLGITMGVISPVAALALVATGRIEGLFDRLHWFLRSRWHLAAFTLLPLLALHFFSAWMIWNHASPSYLQTSLEEFHRFMPWPRMLREELLSFIGWPLILTALLVWLQPLHLRSRINATRNEAVTIWRERLFWMAMGWLSLSLWQGMAMWVWQFAMHVSFKLSGGVYELFSDGAYERSVVNYRLLTLPLLVLAVLLARGRYNGAALRMARFLTGRRRIAAAGVIAVMVATLSMAYWEQGVLRGALLLIAHALWPLTMVGCIAWLAPLRANRQQAIST